MAKKKTWVLAALAGLALFGLGGKANADDDEPDDEPDDDEPVGPPEPPPDPLDVDPPPTPGPKPLKCNYSGCGAPFDNTHAAPSYYALRIQQLGYPISVQTVAANQSTMAVQPQRGYVALFQKHFNSVRENTGGFPPIIAAKLAPLKSSPKLGVDGFNGERTIFAITLAHNAVIATGITWEDLVRIVEGSG